MTLSQAGLQAALSQRTEEVFLECLTIEHPDLSQAIRLVNDKVDLFRAEGAFWGFNGSDDSWTGSRVDLGTADTYLSVIATDADPTFISPGSLGLSGTDNPILRARIRRIAGTGWQGGLFKTGSPFVGPKNISDPTEATLAITNHDFEDGDTGWVKGGAWSIGEYGVSYSGTWSARRTVGDGTSEWLQESEFRAVTPGETYLFGGRTRLSSDYLGSGVSALVVWYNADQTFHSTDIAEINTAADDAWHLSRGEVTAPEGAAYARVGFDARGGMTAGTVYADNVFITHADTWVIAEWDMTGFSDGEGDTWEGETINQFRLDLGSSLGDIFDIDWVAIGTKYIAFPFSARLHARSEERIPEAEIVADNVDQRIVQNLRGLSDGATVRYEAVLAGGEPNAVEQGPFNFEIHGFVADAATVQLRIGFAMGFLNEAWPKDWFAPWNSG